MGLCASGGSGGGGGSAKRGPRIVGQKPCWRRRKKKKSKHQQQQQGASELKTHHYTLKRSKPLSFAFNSRVPFIVRLWLTSGYFVPATEIMMESFWNYTMESETSVQEELPQDLTGLTFNRWWRGAILSADHLNEVVFP